MEEDEELQSKTEEIERIPSPNRNIVVMVVIICILISSSLLVYYWLYIEEEELWETNYFFDWRTNDNGDWEMRVNYGSGRKLVDVELIFSEQTTGNTTYSILNSSGVVVGPVTFLNNGNSEDRLDAWDTFIIHRNEVQEGDIMRLLYRPTGGTIVFLVFPIE